MKLTSNHHYIPCYHCFTHIIPLVTIIDHDYGRSTIIESPLYHHLLNPASVMMFTTSFCRPSAGPLPFAETPDIGDTPWGRTKVAPEKIGNLERKLIVAGSYPDLSQILGNQNLIWGYVRYYVVFNGIHIFPKFVVRWTSLNNVVPFAYPM